MNDTVNTFVMFKSMRQEIMRKILRMKKQFADAEWSADFLTVGQRLPEVFDNCSVVALQHEVGLHDHQTSFDVFL